jgi:MSHA pilin protein MshD
MFVAIKTYRQRNARKGFTLIETALATVIVGLGIVTTAQMFVACSIQNHESSEMTTAIMLANNVQEIMGGLSFADPGTASAVFGPEAGESLNTYDDVDDFDGRTYNPPINSARQTIPTMSQYTQVISVWPVRPNHVSDNSNEGSPDFSKTTYLGAKRVRVRILYRAKPSDPQEEVYRASWIRMDN